jgi:hypothetical protein
MGTCGYFDDLSNSERLITMKYLKIKNISQALLNRNG